MIMWGIKAAGIVGAGCCGMMRDDAGCRGGLLGGSWSVVTHHYSALRRFARQQLATQRRDGGMGDHRG